MALKDEVYKKIDIPILTITGHFDGDQPGAMHYFNKHMTFGKPEIKNKHYLIVGPWSHGGTRHPRKKLAGLEFGDNALVNMEQLHLDWYDWILKGKAKPRFLKKRICYYMMNENQWRYCDHLNEISNGKLMFFLSSNGAKAQDVFSSGFLKPCSPKGRQAADAFQYDPLKLMSKEEYVRQANASFLDQGAAFQQDKLIYHSQPLKYVVEIAGTIKLTLFIKLNVPDTDLGIRLYEIRPDGQSILLAQDFLRARYRKSLARPELVTPGKIYKYIFDKSYFFARMLHRGSRLRLIVSGLNTPVFEKNYNSGGVVSQETAKDSRTAIITLYHDKKHPSKLELPVFRKKD
jgi:putative CocE/NonD family hydrolase